MGSFKDFFGAVNQQQIAQDRQRLAQQNEYKNRVIQNVQFYVTRQPDITLHDLQLVSQYDLYGAPKTILDAFIKWCGNVQPDSPVETLLDLYKKYGS